MGCAAEVTHCYCHRFFVGDLSEVIIGLGTPACHRGISGRDQWTVDLRLVFFRICESFILLDLVQLLSNLLEMCLLLRDLYVCFQNFLAPFFNNDSKVFEGLGSVAFQTVIHDVKEN